MTAPGLGLGYVACRALLRRRLAEPAPGRVQLLTGPRQVGKTTLLLELAAEIGASALYAAADAPEAALPGYLDRLWTRAETIAASQGTAVVLLDEAQALSDWARHLKAQWDRWRRQRIRIHLIASGSSALRLASGSRETLLGRLERIHLTHWSASAISQVFGMDPVQAAEIVVRNGSYPGAMEFRAQPERWAAYVRDAIVEPALGRDLLALGTIRKPGLLRQVFGISVSSPCSILALKKIQGQLQDRGALETISHYLSLLEEAYLVAPLPKYSLRGWRVRAAPPKLVALNNALLAVADPRGIPDREREPDRFGTWVENACLAFAWNAGQTVRYWREEPLEVDGVLEGSWGAWAVEVKTGAVRLSDLSGLLEFQRRHRRFRPLLIADRSAEEVGERAGIDTISWRDFLLGGPPVHHAS